MFTLSQQVFFVVGFIAFACLVTLIGHFSSKGKSNGKSFLTGGSALKLLPLLGTIGATTIGTGSSMGATANGFAYGWGGSIFGVGVTLGLLTMLIFVPVRRFNLITMPEEAQFYFGGSRNVRYVTAVMMFFVEIIWVGVHINGGSKYLSFITGLDGSVSKVIVTVAFLAYTIFGGYLAVVWTDTVQLGVILVGFLSVVVRAIPLAGGYEAIQAAYQAAGNSGALSAYGLESYGILAAASLAAASFFGVISVPVHHTRFFTAQNTETARKAFLVNGVVVFLFSFMPSIIGMSAFTIASAQGVALVSPDFAFVFIATTVLGPVLGLVFLISGLSCTLSSADSDAISGVTILLSDLYPALSGKAVSEKHYKAYSRVGLVAVVLIALLLALSATDIMLYINNVIGALLPGVGVCILLGRLWRRATWQGALACIFGGAGFGILYLMVPPFQSAVVATFAGPAIPATLITLSLGVIVSLTTPADTHSEEERLALVLQSRYE